MKQAKTVKPRVKHFTFKALGPSVFDNKKYVTLHFATPTSCGVGEYITVGNGVRFKLAFIESPQLPGEVGEVDFEAFKLPHCPDHATVIQYNKNLGGYLFAFSLDC